MNLLLVWGVLLVVVMVYSSVAAKMGLWPYKSQAETASDLMVDAKRVPYVCVPLEGSVPLSYSCPKDAPFLTTAVSTDAKRCRWVCSARCPPRATTTSEKMRMTKDAKTKLLDANLCAVTREQVQAAYVEE